MVTTARLLVRPPREADRDRFVELFRDEDVMVFYPRVLTEEATQQRFDHMVAVCQEIPFGGSLSQVHPRGGDLAGVVVPRPLHQIPLGVGSCLLAER